MKNQYILSLAMLATVCCGNLSATSPSSQGNSVKPPDVIGYRYCVVGSGERGTKVGYGTCAQLGWAGADYNDGTCTVSSEIEYDDNGRPNLMYFWTISAGPAGWHNMLEYQSPSTLTKVPCPPLN